ncbi:sigma-70 family RNA polymerase sigma factor [Gemmatimonas sp.]|uniref:RNA polymerase sigma factor n=1 Tax=Gemmatimonas sp. TaxID=1962908 RepID=UPI00286CF215|nr:sigma-70 family RNA polymerase sigma factor [Gemmatimonas sp.]
MSTPEATTADATIIRRVLAGDVNAFALIVDRYHARCLRVATHLLADSDDAEDAVQDAFVRAYRHLGSYRPRSSGDDSGGDRFGAWLLRILVNQCRTRSARMARYARFDTEPSGQRSGVPAELAAEPDHEAAERRTDLAQALALLSPEHREAVVLRFADELSYDEMASITGVGVSALKMRVQRACTRLRALLAEHLHA